MSQYPISLVKFHQTQALTKANKILRILQRYIEILLVTYNRMPLEQFEKTLKGKEWQFTADETLNPCRAEVDNLD